MTARMLGKARRSSSWRCWCRTCRVARENKAEKRREQKHPQRQWEKQRWRAEAAWERNPA